MTLSNGIPIETVSKLMGHAKIAITQTYIRSTRQLNLKLMTSKTNFMALKAIKKCFDSLSIKTTYVISGIK